MGNFIDRIQYFMSHMGINNNQMTVAAGLSVGLIGKAIKLKSGLNSDSIEKILDAYPGLNPTWLLTGKGEMLNISENLNKNVEGNVEGNVEVSDKKNYLPPQSGIIRPHSPIAAEPSIEDLYRKKSPTQQYSGANDIIMGLVEQLKEQSEEIGALRQENSSLKYRLAQLVEDVGDANSVPA